MLAVTVAVFGWLCRYAGLGDYLWAVAEIGKLEAGKAKYAKTEFYGQRSNRTYGGILAGVWTGKYPGVWVWTNHYLRFFAADEYSVFSATVGCKPELLAQIGKGNLKIGRSVDREIGSWREKVMVGDFVQVMVAGEGNEGTPGKLRELWSNDWWYFLQKDLRTACTER